MQNRQKFIAGAVAALLTFGTWMAFMGPHRFNQFSHHNRQWRDAHKAQWMAHHQRCHTCNPFTSNNLDSLSH